MSMQTREDIQRNAPLPLRALMDQYGIRVLEGAAQHRERQPKDFRYRGRAPVVEVQRGDHSAFCRFEEIGGSEFYGIERWLERFPDWEEYVLAYLLADAKQIHWYEQHEGMAGWLYAYGEFGSASENAYEWRYACRTAHDLEQVLGEDCLASFREACEQYTWDTNGL